jgi:DNA repair protein RecO (recombination protein O)
MSTDPNGLHAFVLHTQLTGETSVKVTFLTDELGLVDCRYRGGRTLKKRALLQAFSPFWLSINEQHEQYYVNTVETSGPPVSLQANSLFSGIYVNELLYHALKPGVADIVLFQAYSETLQKLAHTTNTRHIEPILRRFEWMLLKACGYTFSWTHTALTAAAILPDKRYRFVAAQGFIPDKTGILGAHLLALASDNLESNESLRVAKFIMRQAIDHLLDGREIKARSLFLVAAPKVRVYQFNESRSSF